MQKGREVLRLFSSSCAASKFHRCHRSRLKARKGSIDDDLNVEERRRVLGSQQMMAKKVSSKHTNLDLQISCYIHLAKIINHTPPGGPKPTSSPRASLCSRMVKISVLLGYKCYQPGQEQSSRTVIKTTYILKLINIEPPTIVSVR